MSLIDYANDGRLECDMLASRCLWKIVAWGAWFLAIVLALVLLFAATGCAVGTTNLATADRAESTTGTSLRMDSEVWTNTGNRPGSQTLVDDGGLNKNADGQFRDGALLIPLVTEAGPVTTARRTTSATGVTVEERVPVYAKLFVSDPTDGIIRDFEAGFGANGFMVTFSEFGANNSPVIAAYNEQVIESLRTAEAITEEQAAVAQAALATGATIAEALAQVGVNLLRPAP